MKKVYELEVRHRRELDGKQYESILQVLQVVRNAGLAQGEWHIHQKELSELDGCFFETERDVTDSRLVCLSVKRRLDKKVLKKYGIPYRCRAKLADLVAHNLIQDLGTDPRMDIDYELSQDAFERRVCEARDKVRAS